MAKHIRCGIVVLLFLIAVPGYAQFNRTFVASTGTDASVDCSRSNPCRSFSGALTKTNPGGEIIALDSAGYGASLTITQAVSIIAPSGIYAGMTPTGGSAITINAPGATVTLRGLYLNSLGAAKGVDVSNVATLHLENLVVTNFGNSGINFAPATSASVFVKDTISRGNGAGVGGGIVVRGVDTNNIAFASIENSRFERNGSGFIILEDGGITAMNWSRVTVRHSVAAGNVRGISAVVGATADVASVVVEDCLVSGNTVGLFASTGAGATIRVSDSVVSHNTLFAIEPQGTSTITTRTNNTVIDNAGGEIFSGAFFAK